MKHLNCMKQNNKVSSDLTIVLSIFGLDNAGKTSIAHHLAGNIKELNEVTPTLGYKPFEFKYHSQEVVLNDLGGGERLRDIWKHYLSESFGFIFVIDSSSPNRIDECRHELERLIKNEKVSGKPMLVFANKQDNYEAMNESEIVSSLKIENLVNEYQTPCRIELCCANSNKIDNSIRIGFEWLMKFIQVNYMRLRQRTENDLNVQKLEEALKNKERSEKVRQRRAEMQINDT